MRLNATFVHYRLPDKDGKQMVRTLTIDTKALNLTEAEAKLQLRRSAHNMARRMKLGKEGRDWDVILAEVIEHGNTPLLTKKPTP